MLKWFSSHKFSYGYRFVLLLFYFFIYLFFSFFIEQHWHFTNRFLVVSRHLLWSDSWEWGRGRKRLQFWNGALRGLNQHSACICLNLQKSRCCCCSHKTGLAWSESYYWTAISSSGIWQLYITSGKRSLQKRKKRKKTVSAFVLTCSEKWRVVFFFLHRGQERPMKGKFQSNTSFCNSFALVLNWLIWKYHLLKPCYCLFFFVVCVFWIYIMNCNMHYVLRKHYRAEENPHNTLLKDSGLGGMTWQR